MRHITFNYIGQRCSLASINVIVIVNGVSVINDCIDASHAKDEEKTYASAQFTACDLLTIDVSITPYTSSSCNGSACSATLAYTGGAPLPLLFSAFSVERNKELVTLKWETATEISNSGFAIKHNTKGKWQQVGFVTAKALNGNSSDQLNYEFSEINTCKGMTQYRLKQVDIDGAARYSDIKAVIGLEQDAKTTAFPNPSSNGSVNVHLADAGSRDIVVTDMSGRLVKQWKAFNNNSLQASGLPTGMFTMRVINHETGTQTTENIIVAAR